MGNQGLGPTAYLSLILITAGVVWWLLKDRQLFRLIKSKSSSQLPVEQSGTLAVKTPRRPALSPDGISQEQMARELWEIKRLLIEINTRLANLPSVPPAPETGSDVTSEDDTVPTPAEADMLQQIIQRAETGMTTAQIAQQFGITRSEVELLIARQTSR